MLNLNRKGCLAALNRNGSGYDLDMFYLYVDSVGLDTNACAQNANKRIYRAITQTPSGALSVLYKDKSQNSFRMRCAYIKSNYQLRDNYGIDHYLGLSSFDCPHSHSHSQGELQVVLGKSQ